MLLLLLVIMMLMWWWWWCWCDDDDDVVMLRCDDVMMTQWWRGWCDVTCDGVVLLTWWWWWWWWHDVKMLLLWVMMMGVMTVTVWQCWRYCCGWWWSWCLLEQSFSEMKCSAAFSDHWAKKKALWGRVPPVACATNCGLSCEFFDSSTSRPFTFLKELMFSTSR